MSYCTDQSRNAKTQPITKKVLDIKHSDIKNKERNIFHIAIEVTIDSNKTVVDSKA